MESLLITMRWLRSTFDPSKFCFESFSGKVPDGAVRLQGVKGGFEGSIGSLRYYTRALSPIHVRVVCDQGPPELVKVKDRNCFQICALLSYMSSSPYARSHLASTSWLNLILYCLLHGTGRIQQAAVRIFARLLPFTSPSRLASLTLLDNIEDLEDDAKEVDNERLTKSSELSRDSSGLLAVRYLLRIMGLGFYRTKLESVGKVYGSMHESSPVILLPDLTLSNTLLNTDAFVHFLPHNTGRSCLGKGGGGDEGHSQIDFLNQNNFQEPPTQAGMRGPTDGLNSSVSHEIAHGAETLSSEIVSLLQQLSQSGVWASDISSALVVAVKNLTCLLKEEEGMIEEPRSDDAKLMYVEGMAALRVLGGHTDSIRAGVKVDN